MYTLYPNKQVKQKQIFLLYIQLSLFYIITLYEQETFRENSYICIYIVFNVQYFNSSNLIESILMLNVNVIGHMYKLSYAFLFVLLLLI